MNFKSNLLSTKSAASKTMTDNGVFNNNDQASLERKSIIYKILKCLQNYTIEENINKSTMETILLTGGGL